MRKVTSDAKLVEKAQPTEVTVKGRTTWKCKVPPTLPGSASN